MSDNKNKLWRIGAHAIIIRQLLSLGICAFLMRVDAGEAACNSHAGAQYDVYVNSLTAYDPNDDDISAVVSGTSSITFQANISDDLQPSVGSSDMTATWSGGDISSPATTYYTKGTSQDVHADHQTLTTPGEQTITFTLTGDSGCSASKTMTVDVLNVQFIDNSTNVAWSDVSYDAEDNNLTNSYDTDYMSWTLSHVAGQGGDTASIPDSTSGDEIDFGTGGGEYKITAMSTDPDLTGTAQPTAYFYLNVIKVVFVSGITNMWTPSATYSAAGNLTDDSYNTNNLTWAMTLVEGDGTAGIDKNTGVVTYGNTCGGEYTVTATSLDLTNVFASFTLDVVSVQLTNMTFSGGSDLLTDSGGNYPIPEWTKNAMINSPYLYRASDATHQRYATVTAKFTVEPLDFTGNITLAGNGSISPSWLFAPTTVAASSGIAMCSAMAVSPLGISVNCWNPLQIDWTYSISSIDQIGFYDAGQTANQVYVCLANATPTYHTVVHLACSSGHATDANGAVAYTWSQFTTSGTGPANVTTWDGTTKLHYYQGGLFSGIATDTLGLLSTSDGNCVAWMSLFENAVAVNGTTANSIIILPVAPDIGFLVKDWTPNAVASYTTTPPYNWKLVLPTVNPTMVPTPSGGVYGDLTSLVTLYGQNTAPPAEKFFGNHRVALVGSTYYDPSYGVTYTGPADFQATAVWGGVRSVQGDSTSSNMILRVAQSTVIMKITFTQY
jgi:hypothetical protein